MTDEAMTLVDARDAADELSLLAELMYLATVGLGAISRACEPSSLKWDAVEHGAILLRDRADSLSRALTDLPPGEGVR